MTASPPETRFKRRGSTLEIPIRERSASPNHSNNLCARCLELDLEKGFDGTATRADAEDYMPRLEVTIAEVGTYYRQPSGSGCELCVLLCNSRLTVENLPFYFKEEEDLDELRAYEVARDNIWVNSEFASSERQRLLEGEGCRYLAVVPSGLEFDKFTRYQYSLAMSKRGETQGFLIFRRRGSPQPTIFTPRMVAPNFDILLARSWFQYCQHHHKKLCSRVTRTTEGLWLINCQSLTLERGLPQAKYVALSYVWGKPPQEDNSSAPCSEMVFGQMPPQKDLPAVIRDAMKVCIDMGYTYLWIDKFCIDQHNPEEKQRQIRQMDSIYHNAELTIIAAAGSDPTYGLPGISHSRPRKPPPTVTIKDIHIISTLRHPQVAIQSSKWSTRGWTLQEAILSRSRLVFTDDQVYFECNARNCQESLSIPFDTFHVKDKSKFRSIMWAGVFGRGNKDKQYGLFDEAAISPMDNFFRFIDIAQQYTARNLTHDSDSLKALYGIVQEFENSKSQILQIHGIPFLSCVPNKALVSFLNALTWYHEKRSEDHIDEPRPRRRENFPSWSWAGWAGKADLKSSGFGKHFPLNRIDITDMSINIRTGTIFDLSECAQGVRVEDRFETSPTYLQFRAPLVPSLFSYDDSSERPRLTVGKMYGTLRLSTGPWDPCEFLQSLREGGSRQCIYWGRWEINKVDVVMVLQSESNDTWSRVGIISFMESPCRSSFEKLWSKTTLKGPECDRWLKERPTRYFRVS